jgi:hypothetical protein
MFGLVRHVIWLIGSQIRGYATKSKPRAEAVNYFKHRFFEHFPAFSSNAAAWCQFVRMSTNAIGLHSGKRTFFGNQAAPIGTYLETHDFCRIRCQKIPIPESSLSPA